MINNPLVSIMMTTYNRSPLIGPAIKSVLAQRYANWELLVLDDASTDDTEAVVAAFAAKDPRIVYHRSPQNLGISANRNRGFKLAKGQYVAVLDSDDLWLDPEKLATQVAFLEEHKDHALVGTKVRVIDEKGDQTGLLSYETKDAAIRRRLLMRNQFTHSAVLMRRSQLPSEAPYDVSGHVSIWEDYDLFLRLGQEHLFANLPEIMTAYRQHSGNISKAKRREGALAHLDIIKRYRPYYPGYFKAVLKGYLRLLLAWI